MRQLLRDLITAKRAGKTNSERMAIFSDLRRLHSGLQSNRSVLEEKDSVKLWGYKINGHSFKILQLLYHEVFLSGEYFFTTKNQEPVIIDCGANVGFSVLYFKKLYPAATVYAFEPNPHAFQLLERNVKQNKLTNVYLYNIALSDSEGTIPFFIGTGTPGSVVGSIIEARAGGDALHVKCSKLSDFINDLETNVDLLKIDVEGAEWNIVSDLDATRNWSKIDRVIMEYHHKIQKEKGRFAEFLKKFEDNGYDYNMRTHFRQLGRFQDILIYFYR